MPLTLMFYNAAGTIIKKIMMNLLEATTSMDYALSNSYFFAGREVSEDKDNVPMIDDGDIPCRTAMPLSL